MTVAATEASARLAEALRRGDDVAVTTTRTAIVIVLTPAPTTAADSLLPVVSAAAIAATTVRVVRDAIRCRDLPAVGGQRDRAVRRSDLDKWIESRAVKPHAAIDDADLDRRMQRLARGGR